MRLWQFATIFFVALIFFVPYFFRPSFFGMDSYYYLNVVCNGVELIAKEPFLSRVLFEALPCNFFFLKLLLFVCAVVSAFAIGLLGEKLVGLRGWLAGIFVWASLVFSLQFFGLEAEPFAFMLIFVATWLFWSGSNAK